MKRIVILIVVMTVLMMSCQVQKFNVNTNHPKSGMVFGEKTKGKEVAKAGDVFVLGINVTQTDTEAMAKQINADAYTIETKYNLLSGLVTVVTFGVVNYKRVKVIKR
jgi:hypothetical protein